MVNCSGTIYWKVCPSSCITLVPLFTINQLYMYQWISWLYFFHWSCQPQIGTSRRCLPSTSIRIKSCAAIVADFHNPFQGYRVENRNEMKHSVFPENWQDRSSRLQIVRYSQELMLWVQLLFSSVSFSRSVVSKSLWTHELQHAMLPCPPTPRVYSNSCSSSWWCHPTISSSVISFSSHLQLFPESGSFPMSQF